MIYPELSCYSELSWVPLNSILDLEIIFSFSDFWSYPELSEALSVTLKSSYPEVTFLIRKFVFFGFSISSYPEINLVEGNLVYTIIV